ncbi:MAG: hypothetical protein L3J91_04635, partial [Thermoplasmata archaeon]|nr:hypothetical protein [Thermoplasmata archaeon]
MPDFAIIMATPSVPAVHVRTNGGIHSSRERAMSSLALILCVAALVILGGVSSAAPIGRAAIESSTLTGPSLEASPAQEAPRAAPSEPTLPETATGVTPGTICSANWSGCPAGGSTARVSVQVAEPAPAGGTNYSAVDVLVLLETTPYDGGYDASAGDGGGDPCASASMALCEESSLLRTFGTHAGSIASSISAAHPGVEVRFGLVDFFATLTSFDDGDGYQYHVDVGNFTPAGSFAAAVNNSLYNLSHPVLQWPTGTLPESDLSDNSLTSSSISALYLALFGAGVNWTNTSHHVLAYLGSAAPQDPNYPEDYCVSASDYGTSSSQCYAQTCEPSAVYANITSPACVGWIA